MNISIIGTGNVAYHLARVIDATKEHTLVSICGRSISKAVEIRPSSTVFCCDNFKNIPTSYVILICVSDNAIASVTQQLLQETDVSNVLVAHTSGSVPSTVLENFENYGVFYPLQTFTKGQNLDYTSIPICVCANNERTLATLLEIGNSISTNVQHISDEKRLQAHISAVISNNFINHIVYLAQNRLIQKDIDPNIITPLIEETVRKLSIGSAYENQTGPARRNDQNVLKKHAALISDSETLQAMYNTISESIINTYHNENNRRNSTS